MTQRILISWLGMSDLKRSEFTERVNRDAPLIARDRKTDPGPLLRLLREDELPNASGDWVSTRFDRIFLLHDFVDTEAGEPAPADLSRNYSPRQYVDECLSSTYDPDQITLIASPEPNLKNQFATVWSFTLGAVRRLSNEYPEHRIALLVNPGFPSCQSSMTFVSELLRLWRTRSTESLREVDVFQTFQPYRGSDPRGIERVVLPHQLETLNVPSLIQAWLARPERLTTSGEVSDAFTPILGCSALMHRVREQAQRAANLAKDLNCAVLITGERGTGKSTVARCIHAARKIKDLDTFEKKRETLENEHRDKEVAALEAAPEGRFIPVNVAALSETLFESELFGYEKGAFSGADRARESRFEFAGHGTVFLDEIGRLPLSLQPKLLRVLDEGEYERVGSNTTRKIDCLIIAATNLDLENEVRKGRFEPDLYDRLRDIVIDMPSLKLRPEDIAELATLKLQELCKMRWQLQD